MTNGVDNTGFGGAANVPVTNIGTGMPSRSPFTHKKTAEKMHSAKKRHRTEITPADWARCRYAQSNVLDRLNNITFDEQTIPIPRISRKDYSVKDFFEKIACLNKPV